MNEQMFNPGAHAPNKGGPFLPGLKTRGILGRSGEKIGSRGIIRLERSHHHPQLAPVYNLPEHSKPQQGGGSLWHPITLSFLH
jgi:hypothetical protein